MEKTADKLKSHVIQAIYLVSIYRLKIIIDVLAWPVGWQHLWINVNKRVKILLVRGCLSFCNLDFWCMWAGLQWSLLSLLITITNAMNKTKSKKKTTPDDVSINPKQTLDIWKTQKQRMCCIFPDLQIVCLCLRSQQVWFVPDQPRIILLCTSKLFFVLDFNNAAAPCCWRSWCWCWAVIVSLAEPFLSASWRKAGRLQFSCGCLLLLKYTLKNVVDF